MWPDRRITRRLILMVVVFALGLVGVWLPSHLQRRALQERIDHAEHVLGINPTSTDGLATWYTQVVSLREEASGAQRYIPKEDELADVLRGVTEALQEGSLGGPELATRESTHYVNYSAIPVKVQFDSSFPALFGVLQRAESMPRLIRIDRLAAEPARTDPSRLVVNLELSAFFSKGEQLAEEVR